MALVLAVLVALLNCVPTGFALDALPGNGLETGGDLRVRVAVEELSVDVIAIGLNREAISLRCKQALERNGLTAMDDEAASASPSGSELRIAVTVGTVTLDFPHDPYIMGPFHRAAARRRS